MVKFEEKLWGIIRNFVTLGREMPAMLVNAVRIVEVQELVDAKLEASAHSTSQKCLQHETFAARLCIASMKYAMHLAFPHHNAKMIDLYSWAPSIVPAIYRDCSAKEV